MKVELRKRCHEFSLRVALPAAGPDEEGGGWDKTAQRAQPLTQQHEHAHEQTTAPMGKAGMGEREGQHREQSWRLTTEPGPQALTSTMLRLGHTTAKVLGTSSFRAGSGVSVTHCDALSRGMGVNCWECHMRRVNDELKGISVLLLNPLITWVALWEWKILMLSSFSSRRLVLLYIFIYFSV